MPSIISNKTEMLKSVRFSDLFILHSLALFRVCHFVRGNPGARQQSGCLVAPLPPPFCVIWREGKEVAVVYFNLDLIAQKGTYEQIRTVHCSNRGSDAGNKKTEHGGRVPKRIAFVDQRFKGTPDIRNLIHNPPHVSYQLVESRNLLP
ncbi:hypothetical protein B9Z19DRAFT_1069805 [Tuber borchii]|uniref:Uncharacterized protein n=1 Tax=Tuber borchii TaxID=42251 RepID=A0A2T6ZA66_TUBBO|nr:hypothetical protein B9Z19DRAFT_1069805 [Tuber borchii]